jgi:chromosome segregation ATPase
MATSRDEKKRFIGDLLKAADRYIKAAKYTDAMTEVNKALAVEPGNMYALAYNQRIKAALEALRKKEEDLRVKKLSEEMNTPSRSAAPVNADAPETDPQIVEQAEPGRSAMPANEEDLYTIRQQQAQIERFKEELESLRIKHQQEIAVLAGEVQQARTAERDALQKYRAVIDDAEESYRRVEELYAEVVRLNERISDSKHASEDERAALTEEHGKVIHRLESEREAVAAEHRKEILRLESERDALTAEHQRERLRLEQLQETHNKELHRLTEELRTVREALTQTEQKIEEAVSESAGLRTTLSSQESYLKEVRADDRQRVYGLGESLLRAILARQLTADTISPEAQEIMNIVRTEIQMSDEEYAKVQTASKHDVYRAALKEAWDEGYITPEKAEQLALLRRKIGISPELHFVIEDELRSAKKNR